MKMRDLTLMRRLGLGFGILVAMTLLLGVVALVQMKNMSGFAKSVYEHPFTVGTAIRDIRADVFSIQRTVREILLETDAVERRRLKELALSRDGAIDDAFALVKERYLGPKSDVDQAVNAFDSYKKRRDYVIEMAMKGQGGQAAEEVLRGLTPKIAREMNDHIQQTMDFASRRATAFMAEVERADSIAVISITVLLAATFFSGIAVALAVTRSITRPIDQLIQLASRVAAGEPVSPQEVTRYDEIGRLQASFNGIIDVNDRIVEQASAVASGDFSREVEPRSKGDALCLALRDMTRKLASASGENERRSWQRSGLNQLNEKIRGVEDTADLARVVVRFTCTYLSARVGALYVMDHSDGRLKLKAGFAFQQRKGLAESFAAGEGLVGQAALEKDMISVTRLPDGYTRVVSGTGDTQPRDLVLVPFARDERVEGVMEMGFLEELQPHEMEWLKSISETVAVAFYTAAARAEMKELLEKTQLQAEELQVQQEELRAANEELEEQAAVLRDSESRLKQQQEELQAINEELEEKTRHLEAQRAKIAEKNSEMEKAKREIERKARDLEVTGKYKSEFLANMSHELRTPLNSILLLSRSLMENGKGNLDTEQSESAQIIYKSGSGLLHLINEVLDLAKIEAGKMTLRSDQVHPRSVLQGLGSELRRQFEEKGLNFQVTVSEDAPALIRTDRQRLEQILRNLLSNALKFTETGSVTLTARKPSPHEEGRPGVPSGAGIVFDVADTGVGIPESHWRDVFEAFRQLDGTTARKYGGTGLGLSISRDLARILGGEIALESEVGAGATFSLYLPESMAQGGAVQSQTVARLRQAPEPRAHQLKASSTPAEIASHTTSHVADDRGSASADDRTILVVEDDPVFAGFLKDQCRGKGFKTLVASTGEEGLELARKFLPLAVILDIRLPGMDGWAVLDTMKESPDLRHIPVHVMSCEIPSIDAMKRGAVGFLTKPAEAGQVEDAIGRLEDVIDRKIKELLVVEDDAALMKGIVELIGNGDVNTTRASTGAEALAALRDKRFDCVVLDLGLPDMTGFELLERLSGDPDAPVPPVIVYTGRDLSRDEERALHAFSDSIIVKGVKSEERLLDETALFLHRLVDRLPKSKRQMILDLHDRDSLFVGKTVLLADDDMRNVFALSKVLEDKGMRVLKAEDGAKAMEVLKTSPGVDLVLMDVMMPVMDGYEATREIRKTKSFQKLPIVALTAKAMAGDREKCLAAGANDYVAKPVDIDRLLSVMRVWLYQ